MGDVGSLALGGGLGMLAVFTKAELLASADRRDLRGRGGQRHHPGRPRSSSPAERVFWMAPLHHHYEMKGWAEPKIIVRFWIVSFMLALLALTTLKLR